MWLLFLLGLGGAAAVAAEVASGQVGNAPRLPPFHFFTNPSKKLVGDAAVVAFDTPSLQASPLAVRVMASTGLFDAEGYQVQVTAPSLDPALSSLPVGAVFNAPLSSVAI